MFNDVPKALNWVQFSAERDYVDSHRGYEGSGGLQLPVVSFRGEMWKAAVVPRLLIRKVP